eukprot:CAMPEP_0117681132 /NCGR_PEP_ID=MMETSP0804-20121206/18788_1 /TAXON_ID=1074897 /ORGANISM="Tetraselmis astigmatica, Strain CCMP880" /LENGTH=89 /DNA_ID=CAMNT_0005490807 /DNA_START=265 /DNA_END=530 /DNA_ORIENTATION=+
MNSGRALRIASEQNSMAAELSLSLYVLWVAFRIFGASPWPVAAWFAPGSSASASSSRTELAEVSRTTSSTISHEARRPMNVRIFFISLT